MSMNHDFGEKDPELGSDRSQTPEDQALHGQPTDEQTDLDLGAREQSYADADLADQPDASEPDEQTELGGTFEQTTTD